MEVLFRFSFFNMQFRFLIFELHSAFSKQIKKLEVINYNTGTLLFLVQIWQRRRHIEMTLLTHATHEKRRN